jgi:TonB family C-terminal domain
MCNIQSFFVGQRCSKTVSGCQFRIGDHTIGPEIQADMKSTMSKSGIQLGATIAILAGFLIGCAAPSVYNGASTLPLPQKSHDSSMPSEGKVLVRIDVSPDGRPLNVTLSKTSGYKSLDEAAVAAAKKWKFPSGKSRTYLWECRFQLQESKN